jgi:hypothetical protein
LPALLLASVSLSWSRYARLRYTFSFQEFSERRESLFLMHSPLKLIYGLLIVGLASCLERGYQGSWDFLDGDINAEVKLSS